MPSTRLKGSGLVFTVGTTDFAADATNVRILHTDSDSGTVTFEDASKGTTQQASIAGTMIQSLTSSSFWRYAWANSGKEIAFKFAPGLNTTATADKPIFTGTVRIGNRPDLGGDAQVSGDDWTADFEWKVVGEVTTLVS
ncbi:hypothetical protein [Frigoribacterium faeni]|uniref:Uncharacterized protein n=1 Tax=Frigoribacterium faeni TaxID=145483 RepID=A0A7W3PI63_9MICO|nr:hypothetical protein [Frigoribacterium faeni]MBA8812427.1 hypothetical protein [Frigoribacterium faeni]BFF13500.1 hypothetical protein GCM10025699_48030 [Microbacterium flavescens]GEK81856.1 hypothetical protein FFA01_01650 [Frigoribacterium faeni]